MNWAIIENSFLTASFTTVISVCVGFASALWLAGVGDRARSIFLVAAIVALALPPFLVTNCWLHFLGHTGVWHGWLPLNIFSLGGTVWILSLLLWPLSTLLVWGAWQRLEPAQLESDMLVTGWALLRALLFPLARSAIAQASLLIFVLALNNFAVPAILQVKVFPAEMWVLFNTTFDTLGVLRIGWPLVLGPLIVLLWFSRHEVPWPHREFSVPAQLFRQQLGSRWFWSCGIVSLFICFCSVLLPLFQILSLQRTWTELPGALAAGQSAVWNTLWYAATAAGVIVGFTIWRLGATQSSQRETNPKRSFEGPAQCQALNSIVSRFRRNFSAWPGICSRVLVAGAWLVFLLPGVLLGIVLIHAFNHGWSSVFYQSSGIVILALAVRYLAIGRQGILLAEQKLDRELIEVAKLEGATRWQMLRHVLWPQIARPVAVTWYVLFLLCLWDVESMILVVPPGGETLALRIFNLLHYGHNAQVNALCFCLLMVAILPLALERLYSASAYLRQQLSKPRSRAQIASNLGLLFTVIAGLLQTSCSPSSNESPLSSKLFSRVQVIGSRGVGVGQLNKPRSLALDSSDNLYVVDITGRVQKFSTDGTFVLSWQMPQTDLGKPKGMCRDRQGNIVVVEPHYSRVNVFSPQGKLLAQWGSHGTNDGQLTMPRAVAVNSLREIFVSEYQEVELVQTFKFEGEVSTSAIDTNRPGLWKQPRWTGGFGRAGTGPGEFNRPEGLCVDAQDRLYVADSCNHRIQIFSSQGKFLRSYGKPGKSIGELSYPYDICVDGAGRQYVCEFGNSRIQVFDAEDRPIEIIGGPGAEPGRFNNPWGVALDSAGNLYVADSQNHRVQKLVRRE